MKGRKPSLRIIAGGKHPYDVAAATTERESKVTRRGMPCPRNVRGRARELWLRHITPAYWLLSPYDEPKAKMAVNLLVEFERGAMKVGKLSVLRGLLSDLGHDPGTRKRLRGSVVPPPSQNKIGRKFWADDEPDGVA